MQYFEYKITKQVYDWIINKTKTIEIRLYNEKSSKIKIDDIIEFKVLDNEENNIKVKVIGLLIYKDIKALLNDVDINKIGNLDEDKVEELLYEIFGEDKVKSSYIIGIKFEMIGVNNG